MKKSLAFLLILVASTVLASAQTWSESYDAAMKALKSSQWDLARAKFQEAVASRPEDFSGPTNLPGPVTDPRRWRNGAPYSPNFGAAYALYRRATASSDQASMMTDLKTAAGEWEALLAKGQNSRETFYFLGQAYTQLRDVEGTQRLEQRLQALSGKFTWKVDSELLAPEENAAIMNASSGSASIPATPINPTDPSTTPGQATPGQAASNPTTLAGRVQPVATKFALVIGNSESRIPDGVVPFAASDALVVREALVTHAGYPEANVDVVQNSTAAQIMTSAKALADRMPDGATLLIYFTGNGFNLDGKDFLAGVDTELTSDTSTMVAKAELYQVFMGKGARIFAFFQVNRPIVAGRYFGQEVPRVGMIAQTQASVPGEPVYGTVRQGQLTGLYTQAFTSVLAEFRSNRVPVTEFGWQVFYRIRRGDTGETGGSSNQTPTLPVLTNMASDARF